MTAAAPDVQIPDSPVGSRIRWALEKLSPEHEVTEEEVREAFADSFLAQAPPAALVTTLNQGGIGRSHPVNIECPSDFASIVHLEPQGGGMRIRLNLMVEQTEPFKILALGAEMVWPAAKGASPRAWEEAAGGEVVRASFPGANAVSDDLAEELEELLTEAREERHMVGLAASVGGPDGIVWFRGIGAANSEGDSVNPDTVFRIGSVSKTMTAIGVMQLVEAGKFSLDDDVNQVLSAYRIDPVDGGDPITVRHLLTHSSGLDPRSVDIGCDFGTPLPPLAEYYSGGLKANRGVGESWAYSNDAFATLGHIVEEQTGKPFAEAMRESLFRPLEMDSTSFRREEHLRGRLVTGYNVDGDKVIETLDRDVIVAGAGSVYSTAEDMAKYTACLMRGGAPVLKTEALEQMWAAQDIQLQGGADVVMGLGFLVHDIDGHRVVWHNGGWPGASTSMWAAPEDSRSLLLTANVFGGQQSGALDQLGKQIIRRLLGLPPVS
jgi:CubicO group peptidase (beta-lactamase class C family)